LTRLIQAVVVAGGVAQVDSVVQGSVAVDAGAPFFVSAFTKTGMTAPVFKENTRWFRTRMWLAKSMFQTFWIQELPLRTLASSPEWLVIDIHVEES
jgi:hypothetical protein